MPRKKQDQAAAPEKESPVVREKKVRVARVKEAGVAPKTARPAAAPDKAPAVRKRAARRAPALEPDDPGPAAPDFEAPPTGGFDDLGAGPEAGDDAAETRRPSKSRGPRGLIIAEKPSVAREIANALGGFRFSGGYGESPKYLVAWAVGHLLEFEPPEAVKPELARRWRCENLPVIPETFRLIPRTERGERPKRRGAKGGSSGAGSQLKLLGRLLRDRDVTFLVNACDAGREGERIFRTITEHFGVNKPTQRLWVNAMTRDALRAGFEHLAPGESKDALARAAACRAEADWLIGMNGTMAFTSRLQGRGSARGAASVYSLGRVQTPTLALVVDRELEIRAFRAEPYWEVEATFNQDEVEYAVRWFDPCVKQEKDGPSPHRIASREAADAIVERVKGREGRATDESRRTTQRPPLLFDLTSLQAEANRRFRMSPKATLQALERLYLAGQISYPRTGCRYLASADTGTVAHILDALRSSPYASLTHGVEASRLTPANRRLFNDPEVRKEDHTAIVPTKQVPAHPPEGIGGRLYDLIVRAFLAALYPDAVSDEVTRTTVVGEDHFRSRGRILRVAGWRAVYGASADEQGDALPVIDPSRAVGVGEVVVHDLETKPPARFSEATLLKAMETAGRVIEEEELREAMKDRGLGTPATRAEILEKLIVKGYMERLTGGKELGATAKGIEFVEILRRVDLPELARAELTGDWEHKLRLMERGDYSREHFMTEIRGLTERLVERACGASFEEFLPEVHDLPACPRCGSELIATPKTYACSKKENPECAFFVPRVVAGRPFQAPELAALITEGRAGPFDGFRSARGGTFSAAIALSAEGGVDLIWDGKEGSSSPQEPVSEEPAGVCLMCGGPVMVYEKAYRCASGPCKFSLSRTLLGAEIPLEELQKLLAGERTGLLTMRSRKTGRDFQTWLRLDKKGGLKFEFPPREGRTAAGGAARKSGGFRRRRTASRSR